MARYIQRIALLGKERWIGWEVDGGGTDIPGLTLADDLSDDELRARGIKEFRPLPFEHFIGMGAVGAKASDDLLDQDVDFRLDALQVGMDRFRDQGITDVPRSVLIFFFGNERQISHPHVLQRFRTWEAAGAIQVVGRDDCFLKITGRLS